MKSDVIRKRSRHDARRAANGAGLGETPSASPGVSRRTSPSRESSPTLAPDSSTAAPQQMYDYSSSTDDMDFTVSKSELIKALGSPETSPNTNSSSSSNNGNGSVPGSNTGGSMSSSSGVNSNVENGNSNNNTNPNLYSFNFHFPGPYHPDHLLQYSYTPLDALPFPSGDYEPDLSLSPRTKKRRRMSSDSASEPPSSVVSFSSFADGGYSTTSSATSHSQRSSISALASEFPFSNAFSNNNTNPNHNNGTNQNTLFNSFRGSATNAFWHPPMVQDNHSNDSSHSFLGLHPPMLPPSEDSPMDYLHPPMMHHDDDALFSTYLHPPMSLPSDDNSSTNGGSGNGNANSNKGGGSGSNGNGSSSGMHGNSGNHYYVAQEYGLDMRIY